MSISFACAGCGEQYTVGDELAGKKGRCHRCGSSYDIPYQSAASAAGVAINAPSVYGFTHNQPGTQAKKAPRVKYPTLYEDKISSRQKSRLLPLAILLLLLLAGAVYLYRDRIHTWLAEHETEFKEELEHVRDKVTGEHSHEKESDK